MDVAVKSAYVTSSQAAR